MPKQPKRNKMLLPGCWIICEKVRKRWAAFSSGERDMPSAEPPPLPISLPDGGPPGRQSSQQKPNSIEDESPRPKQTPPPENPALCPLL